MPQDLQQALMQRNPQLNLLRGAQTIQAAPPGDIDPAELMRGEIPLPGEGIARLGDAAASARDLLKSGDIMDKMYAEANPIYRQMQLAGKWGERGFQEAVDALHKPMTVGKGGAALAPQWVQQEPASMGAIDKLLAEANINGVPLRPAASHAAEAPTKVVPVINNRFTRAIPRHDPLEELLNAIHGEDWPTNKDLSRMTGRK